MHGDVDVFALRRADSRTNDDMYLVAGERAIGPLADELWPHDGNEERWWPDIVGLQAILASGGHWQPTPAMAHETVAWYTHVVDAGGERFVERTAGYRAALRAFLASKRGAAMVQVRHLEKPWAFPFVRLEADGRWMAGDDALTQPLVLPLWGPWPADLDPIPGLESAMSHPFFLRLRWDRVGRWDGIEFVEPGHPNIGAGFEALDNIDWAKRLTPSRIVLPWFERASLVPGKTGDEPPLDADNVFALARDIDDNIYVVAGMLALGPLPYRIVHDAQDGLRRAITHRELEAQGVKWRARPGNLYYPDAWYVLRESPDGVALVDRFEGYLFALRAFVHSKTGTALLSSPEHVPPWAIPFVRLHPTGIWETGADVLTEPVILAACAPSHDWEIATEMGENLEEALHAMQWYPDMVPEY